MTEYKLSVEQLVKRQTGLCNALADEVKKALDSGNVAAAGLALYKLKLGQPRNRRLLRFMEDPELRRLLEKNELKFHKDNLKLKDELYFTIDEKKQDADLTEKGRMQLAPGDPDSFTIPDMGALISAIQSDDSLSRSEKDNTRLEMETMTSQRAGKIHHIAQLLKAYSLYERDVHYVVRDGKITIIDESTGREMAGRRWSDGLHQAVEAKENVAIEKETRTYASITIQNYFRIYEKLAGMTGTAETEAAEFHDIYQLDVLPIPTNLTNIRIDGNDRIFKTRREKFNAVVQRISDTHAKGQPVLVGTASVDASETLSRMLKRARIPHTVLNAKFHEQEAEIVSKAGQRNAVTVSTNMAGRGTDIALGEGISELGGLFVIATERHTSRRVDRQLRGRCSRQGDPGRSEFFLSLEDDLLRNHAAPDHMAAVIERAGKSQSLRGLVENSQTRVEQHDYRSRKQILDFDDVMNMHRGIVYGLRNNVLFAGDTRKLIDDIIEESVAAGVANHPPESHAQNPDYADLHQWISTLSISLTEEELENKNPAAMVTLLVGKVSDSYFVKAKKLPVEILDQEERRAILFAIDDQWQEHLEQMEELREGVFLRSQGQKDPLVEYKNESYVQFSALMESIHRQALGNLFHLVGDLEKFLSQMRDSPGVPLPSGQEKNSSLALNFKREPGGNSKESELEKTPRNSPCPCESGKKYKQCCGKSV